tara:strand:+ start:272 stop:511 length:240 start_codon:yes stop_codon:yes gene_type:complete
MEPNTLTTLVSFITALLAAGAAYGAAMGGVKSGLNGARESIQSIERICNRLDEKVDDHGQRITKTEVEIINLKERSGNG